LVIGFWLAVLDAGFIADLTGDKTIFFEAGFEGENNIFSFFIGVSYYFFVTGSLN
jgi:hypothetical protein